MRGHGAVFESLDTTVPDAALVIERLSEEHATVRVEGDARLATGDLVRILPNHSCVVSNLVDAVWLVNGREVEERIEIAARGQIA